MGNLLGTPITDKETHVGITVDEMSSSSSPDGGGLQYGISSMQGWRVHMEDAHIVQPFLYAERPVDQSSSSSSVGEDEDQDDDGRSSGGGGKKSKKTRRKTSYQRIPLPNHALFAVFDGHGGKFAAEYASMNLLRVLCRSGTFVEYAQRWSGRRDYLSKVREGLLSSSSSSSSSSAVVGGVDNDEDDAPSRRDDTTPMTMPPATEESSIAAGGEEGRRIMVDAAEEMSDRLRLQQLKKRGHESDERVRAIKEQVRVHFAAADAADDDAKGGDKAPEDHDDHDDMEHNAEYQYAQATYDRELIVLLERSLRDAFVDLDAEILGEVRGDARVEDANVPYALGHHHSDFGPVESRAVDVFVKDGGSAFAVDHPVPVDDEDAGTTAVVVMTTPRWMVCANAGDSRAVYSRSSHRAVPLSYDHKPDDDKEERRIREAGGYVSGGRVEGDLAVSRGLGDYRFKDPDVVVSGSRGEAGGGARRSTMAQRHRRHGGEGGGKVGGDDDCDVPMLRPSEQKVSPVPDIIVQSRDPDEDEFVVIACDGIWDVQSNNECVRMVADIFAEGESNLGLVCEEVLDLCLMKGSKDNMTACVIKFPKQTIGKGGGVLARRERRGAEASTRNGGRDNIDKQQKVQSLRRVFNPYVPPAQREGGQAQEEKEESVDGDDEEEVLGGDGGNR